MGTGVHCFVRLLYCALYLFNAFNPSKYKKNQYLKYMYIVSVFTVPAAVRGFIAFSYTPLHRPFYMYIIQCTHCGLLLLFDTPIRKAGFHENVTSTLYVERNKQTSHICKVLYLQFLIPRLAICCCGNFPISVLVKVNGSELVPQFVAHISGNVNCNLWHNYIHYNPQHDVAIRCTWISTYE